MSLTLHTASVYVGAFLPGKYRREKQESALSKLFSLNFSEENGLPLLSTAGREKERAGFLSKTSSSKANLPLLHCSCEIHNMKYKQGTPLMDSTRQQLKTFFS